VCALSLCLCLSFSFSLSLSLFLSFSLSLSLCLSLSVSLSLSVRLSHMCVVCLSVSHPVDCTISLSPNTIVFLCVCISCLDARSLFVICAIKNLIIHLFCRVCVCVCVCMCMCMCVILICGHEMCHVCYICVSFPNIPYDIPPQKLFGNKSTELIEYRRIAFQHYLQGVSTVRCLQGMMHDV